MPPLSAMPQPFDAARWNVSFAAEPPGLGGAVVVVLVDVLVLAGVLVVVDVLVLVGVPVVVVVLVLVEVLVLVALVVVVDPVDPEIALAWKLVKLNVCVVDVSSL